MREATAIIDLGAIRRNLQGIRARVGNRRILAVVKADGYGHGLERVVRALRDADGFGVASLEDATRIRQLEVRQGWSRKPVVLLSGVDESRDVPLLESLGLQTVLHDHSQLELLERSPRAGGHRHLWLKLDTGMHRLGFAAEQTDRLQQVYARVLALGAGRPPVWMTHFSSADEANPHVTTAQIDCFQRAVAGRPGLHSLANSAGITEFPAAHGDWVRPGGLLYGLSTFADRTGAQCGFEPAMTLVSRIIAVKHIAAGAAVGYGGSERMQRPTRLGIISIGYGDGYPRHASGQGATVLVDGHPAPLLGRVSMDLSCVDLTDLPLAQVGSVVTLWGAALPTEQLARHAHTISYELTCGVTRRVAVREIE